MPAFLTIAAASFRDLLVRPVLWLNLVATAAMVYLCRFLALGALGQELALMKEMALSSMSLGLLLLAVVSSVPNRRQYSELEARRVLLTRPLNASTLVLGKLLAVMLAMLLSTLFWAAVFWLALWAFATGPEAPIFHWNRPSSAGIEFLDALPAMVMVVVQGLVLASCAQLFGSGGSQVGALVAVLVLLIAGTWTAPYGAAAWLVPDFSLTSPGRWLHQDARASDVLGALLHAAGWMLLLGALHAQRLTRLPRRAA